MVCYIKSKANFRTIGAYQVLNYDVIYDSIYDDVSQITVETPFDGAEGDFIFFNGFQGIISGVTPNTNGNTNVLQCCNILKIFDRDLVASPMNGVIEMAIQQVIHQQFKYISDTVYAMPYMTAQTTSTTVSTVSPDTTNGIYNFYEYLAKMRRMYGIFLQFIPNGNDLNIYVGKKNSVIQKIDFGNTRYKLKNENYSMNSVAKITVLCEEDNSTSDWYLMDDGQITSSPPESGRATGRWDTIFVTNTEDILNTVTDTFARNSHSHSIEFMTDVQIPFFSNVQLRIGNRVLSSYISSVRKQSGNDMWIYKSGELRTTLTEKLKEMI